MTRRALHTMRLVSLAGVVVVPSLVLTPWAMPAVQVRVDGRLTMASMRVIATDRLVVALFLVLLGVYLLVSVLLTPARCGRGLGGRSAKRSGAALPPIGGGTGGPGNDARAAAPDLPIRAGTSASTGVRVAPPAAGTAGVRAGKPCPLAEHDPRPRSGVPGGALAPDLWFPRRQGRDRRALLPVGPVAGRQTREMAAASVTVPHGGRGGPTGDP